ncbi:phosphotransferase [Sporosarcina trichiuri]|uniref:phosphotransferase n=1 Tax=Sporosarcina trichiuri TaxID=3056445 RepID=UPI0025B4EEDC|nr:phosphotransferase [Sporosarcina sp. 0.2-SM1T-5]WJY27292.1 phosphotransferase [Sporosarcina sp. 0.2-SM1T-5]
MIVAQVSKGRRISLKSIHILSQFGFDIESEQESIYPFSPVYRIEDFIVKRTQSPKEKADRLVQYTAHLEAAGIPVVTPVNLSTENPQCGGNDCYVCYPYIEGTAYVGTDQEIIQAGRLLGQIHRLSSPDNKFQLPVYDVFDFYDHEVEEHLRKIKKLADRYEVNLDCARLETLLYQAVSRQEVLKASPLKWVETPHDYKANNLVYQETPVLIDPDNAAWIPRIFDLALALLLFHNEHASAPHRAFTPREWQLFLAGYLTYQSLTEAEIETWHDAVLHVFLDEVMWLMAEVEEDWQRPEQRALFVSVTNVIAELDAYSLAALRRQTGR